MLFNSVIFAFFLPTVFVAYWFVFKKPLRLQNLFLLVVSYIFYGWWDWRFLVLIFTSSLIDFIVGSRLDQTERPALRRLLLGTSLCVNLGVLGFFKYFNFFIDSFAQLLTLIGLEANPLTLRIILPVGISFYTFQTLSYTIDIYRKQIKSTQNLIEFFAFVSFFPQLVAGPIERASALLPQFQTARIFDTERAKDGLRQMLWGFFTKIVVADNLAPHVSAIFDNYTTMNSASLCLGAFLFAIQIYGDFAGYSNIAIGAAKLFGFSLMQNFNYPYFSRNIAEFWRRWHISLSTWFRDYVYIPLGGSRVSRAQRIWNIIITFTVSGFWHGASWTFIVWGFLNGLYYLPIMLRDRQKQYVGSIAKGKLLPSFRELLAILTTFFFTLLAWVFFRSSSIADAFGYLLRTFSLSSSGEAYSGYAQALLLALTLLVIEWYQRDKQHPLEIATYPIALRWLIYVSIIVVIIVLGSFGEQEFIYFQF